MAEVATASWSLWWDTSRKCWYLVQRSEVGPVKVHRTELVAPVDALTVEIVSRAITAALEGLLVA